MLHFASQVHPLGAAPMISSAQNCLWHLLTLAFWLFVTYRLCLQAGCHSCHSVTNVVSVLNEKSVLSQ